MSEEVKKQAKIVAIKDTVMVLEICSMEACNMCIAKGACGANKEGDSKYIELLYDGIQRNVGDIVTLSISTTVGLKGAFYVYFLPVILVFSAIILIQRFYNNDFLIGIMSICVLVIYFIVLWIFRKKIEKQISIKID